MQFILDDGSDFSGNASTSNPVDVGIAPGYSDRATGAVRMASFGENDDDGFLDETSDQALIASNDDDESATVDNERHKVGVKAPVKSKRYIIVEPILALFFVAYIPGSTLSQQFIYSKFSQKYNLSSYEQVVVNGSQTSCETADVNDTYYWVQTKVQSESAIFGVYLDVASTLISAPLVFVYGSFSDIFGRKPLMLLPLIGGVLRYIIYVAVIINDASIYILLIGNVVESLFGGASTIISTCFAYIADTTDHDKRTLKITINEVIFSLANATAQVTLGFLIKATGFLIPFYGLLGIHVINMLYLLFFVPETRPYVLGTRVPLANIVEHVKGCLRVYTQPDQFGKRWALPLCVPCVFFCALVFVGRWNSTILYMLNSPLCWTSIEIGLWGAAMAVSTNVGNIAMVLLFIRRLGDIGLAMVACVSGIANFLTMSVAVKSWIMFISPVAGFASFLTLPMLRSIGSKRTASDKQGSYFASFGAIEVVCGLVGTLLFNSVYQSTLGVWKGFVFLTMAMIQFLGLISLMIFQLYIRRSRASQTPQPDFTREVNVST